MYQIPANATRIRYLEGTGDQFIDTGYKTCETSRMVFDAVYSGFQYSGYSSTMLFGSRTLSGGSAATALSAWLNSNGQMSFNDFGFDSGWIWSPTISAGARHTYEISGRSLYVDGSLIKASTASDSYRSTVSVCLLRANMPSGYQTGNNRHMKGRIYSFQASEGGELKFNGVPVRVGQVGYLFDRVSGQLFGNAGTGDFVLGPDTFAQGVIPTRMMVAGWSTKPPYDAEVEYLKSTGTQYVDTGVLPSTGMEIGVKCSASSVSGGGWDGVVGTWIADESDKCISIRYNTMTKIAPTYAGAVRYAGVGEWIVIQSGSILEIVLREGAVSINGTEYTWNTVPLTVPSYPFLCFVENLGGSPWSGRYLKGRIYYLWMMRNGKLVFDAIPVRKGTTGYLYDRVTKQLFGNAGTGSFVLGPDK